MQAVTCYMTNSSILCCIIRTFVFFIQIYDMLELIDLEFVQVAIITPFNFPLEIPLLQLMGALYMGNKPVLKVDSKVSIVMEQMIRLLHDCGLPAEDMDFINSDGAVMNKLLLEV